MDHKVHTNMFILLDIDKNLGKSPYKSYEITTDLDEVARFELIRWDGLKDYGQANSYENLNDAGSSMLSQTPTGLNVMCLWRSKSITKVLDSLLMTCNDREADLLYTYHKI